MRLYLAIALTAACGDGTPIPITITSASPPAFIVARNDTDTDWVTPTQIDDRTFELVASGPYRVTWGCDGVLTEIQQIGRTPIEGSEIDLNCLRQEDTVTLLATMKLPGTLTLGRVTHFANTPDRRLPVESAPSVQNIVAFDDQRVLVLRDITPSPGLEISVDLAAGVELEASALDAPNLESGEVVRATVFVSTRETFGILFDGEPGMTRAAPAGVFEAGEQSIELSASRGITGRFARSPSSGAANVVLPEPVRQFAFAPGVLDLAATWDSDLRGEVLVGTFAFDRETNSFFSHQFRGSAAYMTGRAGEARFELDTVPDVPERLVYPETSELTRQFLLDTAIGGLTATETVTPSVR